MAIVKKLDSPIALNTLLKLIQKLVELEATGQLIVDFKKRDLRWYIPKADFQKNPTANEVKMVEAERKARGK